MHPSHRKSVLAEAAVVLYSAELFEKKMLKIISSSLPLRTPSSPLSVHCDRVHHYVRQTPNCECRAATIVLTTTSVLPVPLLPSKQTKLVLFADNGLLAAGELKVKLRARSFGSAATFFFCHFRHFFFRFKSYDQLAAVGLQQHSFFVTAVLSAATGKFSGRNSEHLAAH